MEFSEEVFPFQKFSGEMFDFGSEIPEFHVFRAFVDRIRRRLHKLIIMSLYLSAARVCEVCRRVCPSDLTKPYGIFSNWTFADYLGEKVLLLRFCISKRLRKKEKKEVLNRFLAEFKNGRFNVKLAKELKNVLSWKIIALPVNPQYEPWTIPLIKYIKENRSLSFNLTRQHIWRIVKENLKELDRDVHTHSLRHYRITHLHQIYDFDAWDLSAYAGWTVKTSLGRMGMPIPSEQLDVYLHLSWKRYFPKLLKPLKI